VTTRALVANQPWSTDRARAGMVGRSVAGIGEIGRRRVRVIPEPLVRAAAGGGRVRAVRVEIAGRGDDLPLSPGDVVVRTAGSAVTAESAAAPAGSVRLLVPAADTAIPVEVAVPSLGDGTVAAVLTPVRDWTIHLVHHSHLDIGYTDPQGTVLNEHMAFLDSCLDLVRATRDWPDDARFRWAVESLWSFEQWERARPAHRVAEFLDHVRAGQIELTAMPFNLHTDMCSTDELHELLRLARRVRDRHGIRFTTAMQTDVPGSVAGLPDVLSSFGVRYLSVAHNWAGRSVPHLVGGQHLPRLFRWQAPSGASVLVWMTDSPHGLAYMEGPVLGFDTSYDVVDDLLPPYLTSLSTHGYPFDPGMFGWHGPDVVDREPYPWDLLHLRVQGHFGDNAPPRLVMSETVRRWNDQWLFPHLRMSRNEDFFRDAEDRVGDRIRTFEGDWGDWWVEGVGSGARPVAMTRHAQATLPRAQTLSAIAGITARAAVPDEAELSDTVYRSAALFDEHTWGASDPWTDGDSGTGSGEQQWHWKYAHGLRAAEDADAFLAHASAQLGSVLPSTGSALLTGWAVNTVAYPRSAVVSLFVAESRVPLDIPLEVRDARTGQPLPVHQRSQQNPSHRDAGRFLDVAVRDVPAVGMCRLDVIRAAGSPPSPAGDPAPPPGVAGVTMDNGRVRVEVDLTRACIASITDLGTGRQVVAAEPTVGFNGYVYDRYGTAGGFNHLANKTSTDDELGLLGSRATGRPAALVSREVTPVSESLTYEFGADGVRWVRVTLTLARDSRVLTIENRLSKPATMAKESAYFAFPFAVEHPTVRWEITGAVTGDGIDHVPGAPQHMRAVRNWVTFTGRDGAVAWVTAEAPLVQPETIALPYAPFPASTRPREHGTLYSWVHNNLWDTNFPSQQGFEASFRYAVAVGQPGEDAACLGPATAADLVTPVAGVVSTSHTVDGPVERSLLSIGDGRIRVVSVTSDREDPDAVLVRLQSSADETVATTIDARFPVAGAQETTYLGDTLRELAPTGGAVPVTVPRFGVTAVRIRLGAATPTG